LKVNLQILDDHRAKLLVEADAAEFEKAKQVAARQLSKRVKIPGFRPGKAPYAMVVRFLGEEVIQEEALEILAKDLYPKALVESGVKPYGPGSLEDFHLGETPSLEFVVELRPEVELGDFRSIRLPYELEALPEEEVDEAIENLRFQHAIIEKVDRPAQEGDLVLARVSAKYVGTDADSEAIPMPKETLTFEIEKKEGEEDESEWPFPGFSRALIGHAAGETFNLRYAYPESAFYSVLKGKEVEFTVTVEEVKSRNLPELNDEFAQAVGDFATLEDLRASLRKYLEERTKDEYNYHYSDQVLNKIIEASVVKFPPALLEAEIDNLVEELEERLSQQNLDLDLYLKVENKDMETLRQELRPTAERRLKRGLVMKEIINALDIQVDEDELRQETAQTLEVYSQLLPEKEFRKLLKADTAYHLVGEIAMDMLIDRVRDRLCQIAQGLDDAQDQSPAPEGQEKSEESATNIVGEVSAQHTGIEETPETPETNPRE